MQMSRGVTANRIFSVLRGYSSVPLIVSGSSLSNLGLDDTKTSLPPDGTATFDKDSTAGPCLKIDVMAKTGHGHSTAFYALPLIDSFSEIYVSYGYVKGAPAPQNYRFCVGLMKRTTLSGDLQAVVDGAGLFSFLTVYGSDQVIELDFVSTPETVLYNSVMLDITTIANRYADYWLFFDVFANNVNGIDSFCSMNIYDTFLVV